MHSKVRVAAKLITWRYAEEASFWVDRPQLATFVKPHPGNVITYTLNLVARHTRHHHSQVSFTACRGKRSCDVFLLALGVGDAKNLPREMGMTLNVGEISDDLVRNAIS